MTQEQQPEALRLAERLESAGRARDAGRPPIQDTERKAAAELRRLHARVQELEAQQKPKDCDRPECISHGCVGPCLRESK